MAAGPAIAPVRATGLLTNRVEIETPEQPLKLRHCRRACGRTEAVGRQATVHERAHAVPHVHDLACLKLAGQDDLTSVDTQDYWRNWARASRT